MSAEAPKRPGITAPHTPQEPQGCLPGFLRRFFAELPESQSSEQSTSRSLQLPSGLEDFAGKIQQGIDSYTAAQRQQELVRRNAEVARKDAEAKEQARAIEEQKIFESQERIRKERAITEGSKVLQDFQIADRLEIIKQTAWEGKGTIRPVKPEFDVLGGFELVHQYPSHKSEKEGNLCRGRWRYVDSTDSTRLIVKVLGQKRTYVPYYEFDVKREKEIVENGRFLEIKSFTSEGSEYVAKKVVIPVDTKDSKTLLEEALLQDIQVRIAKHDLPAQVEKRSREERSQLPHWQNWIEYYNPQYDPSGPD